MRIQSTRISVDSAIYAFLDGESPESIAQNFPLLSSEQVYGAIAFYLANRDLVDAYLAEEDSECQVMGSQCRTQSLQLYQNLKTAQVPELG